MCVITEKKLQLNIAMLCFHNFLSLVVFWLGGGPPGPLHSGYAYDLQHVYYGCNEAEILRTASLDKMCRILQKKAYYAVEMFPTWLLVKINKSIQIISFIILTVMRQIVQRFGGVPLHVIAPGQHSSFRRNISQR